MALPATGDEVQRGRMYSPTIPRRESHEAGSVSVLLRAATPAVDVPNEARFYDNTGHKFQDDPLRFVSYDRNIYVFCVDADKRVSNVCNEGRLCDNRARSFRDDLRQCWTCVLSRHACASMNLIGRQPG